MGDDPNDRSARSRYDPDLIRRSGAEWRELQSKVIETRQEVRELNRELFGRPGLPGAVQRMEQKIDAVAADVGTQIANAGARRTARISGETVKLIAGVVCTALAMLIVFLLTQGHA